MRLANLHKIPEGQRVKQLAAAIKLEFAKTAWAMEMDAKSVLAKNPNLRGLGFAANDPSFERIKSFIGQKLLGAKYATASDTPELNAIANQFAEFFHTNMPEMDMAFTLLFGLVDLRGTTHDHFDIIDTNAGLSWTQRKPGEPTKIRRNITESKTTVNYLEYTEGLGLLDSWLQFNQFWNIEEAIMEFRATYYDKMAEAHYGLLTALGAGVNQAFDTDDVITMNNAAATIVRACKTKGYAVGDNPTMYAVCAKEKVGRLERALTAQRGSAMVDFGTMKEPLVARIGGVIGTTHVAAADTGYYLVLPARKVKRGVWKDLTIRSTRNEYVSAEDLVGVGQYNAAIGDSAQVRRVLYV